MEDKANISRKFIMAAVLLLIPVFAAMIIIFVLLSNGVIDVLVAFILMIVVFGVILFGIISLIRTIIIPIRAAITGVSMGDKGNEKIAAKLEKLSERTDDMGEIMAVKHRDYEIYGLQFHPESILTVGGKKLLENFLDIK